VADRVGDDGWRLEARFAFGQTLALHKADFEQARDVLGEGEGIYRISEHGDHAFAYGQDPGVYCLCLGGWVLWLLGFSDSALVKLRRAIDLADAVGHALSRAAARLFTAQVVLWRGEVEEVRRFAVEALAIAESAELPFFDAWANALLAWATVEQGEFWDGRAQLSEACGTWEATAGELLLPYFRCHLAEAHARTGFADAGLALVSGAFETAERNGEAFLLAEMHRVAGNVFKIVGRASNAEERYRRAIEIARAQGAKSLELSATLSLARLWAEHGDRRRATDLVRPLYKWFTEGLTTPDLIDAKSLAEAMD